MLGEAKVYDLLAKVHDDRGFSVHSVNLPEHEYKRWGEADFVVVSKSGVTLLEIKGGTVSYADRTWRYENARGKAITSTEGPARQALSAAIALERLLTENLGRKIRCRWGVAFPLCSFNRSLAELPQNRLADIHSCQDVDTFDAWLKKIPYDQHQPEDFAINGEEIEAIRELIVPEFSAATSLGLAARSAQDESIRLTERQFSTLESLDRNPRLCISGGAGTGKTELAVLCARAEKAIGRTPAIVTNGKSLSLALRERMTSFGVPVVSETLPAGTDTLIVDEGQDYAHPDQMKRLFGQLPGGLQKGRWRWFMDPNLQFMDKPPDPDCLSSIEENAVSVTLNRNVRSTREIVESIRNFLGADVGISQIDGFGIKVGFHDVRDSARETEAALRILERVLEDGIQPSEIAVLGPEGVTGPTCGYISDRHTEILRPLSGEGRIQSSRHGVVCSITDFRGLEARVVLLVDLHLLPADHRGDAMLYIGMSRASASLQLLVLPSARAHLKSLLKKSFNRKFTNDRTGS